MQAGMQKVQTCILKPLLTQQPLEFLLLFSFFFLTVILSYGAAVHVNCSVASFQSSDLTVQMSPSTWQ